MTTGAPLRLFDFQREAVSAVDRAWDRNARRLLGHAPTGSGKTIIAGGLVVALSKRLGRLPRALFMAPSEEILFQAGEKFGLVIPGVTTGLVKAERHEVDAQITIASVQTLVRRLHDFPRDWDLIIVDEAHHATAPSYREILRYLRAGEPDGPLLFGCTATPDRGDGTPLSDIFDEIAFSIDLLDLIDSGHLSPVRAIRVHFRADYSRLEKKRGDITEASAAAEFARSGGAPALVQAVERYAPGQSTIAFTPGVQAAHDVAATAQAKGISAAAIDGSLPSPQRQQIIDGFRKGQIQLLANCSVLLEGFDAPRASCAVLARPTTSRPLYSQMAGRVLRRHPEKHCALLIDMQGLTARHELMTAASLAGLESGELLDNESLSAAVTRKRLRLLREGHAQSAAIEMHAREVRLFKNRPIHWTPAGDRFATSTGHSQVVLRPDDRDQDRWTVVERLHDNSTRILRGGITLELAQGIAEEHVRATGNDVLTNPNAAWLVGSDPPSEKQRFLLRKFRIPYTEGMTKGEAFDLIGAAMARRVA